MDVRERERLLASSAESYARVAITNIQREYPTAVPYFITEPGPLPLPRELHPSFYGCLDWHSAVEMHWVLVRLLRLYPQLASRDEALRVLGDDLSAEKLAIEASYFEHRSAFERPYGWGWALRLADEIARSEEDDARGWRTNIAPLATVLRDLFCEWLPKATYPQRTGLHANSAFGLLLAWEFARSEEAAGRGALADAIREAAHRWYGDDVEYPARFEPSGSDFLSPALTEAALMASVLDRGRFARWFGAFLPTIPEALLTPAMVTDVNDGQIAHLHGLNL